MEDWVWMDKYGKKYRLEDLDNNYLSNICNMLSSRAFIMDKRYYNVSLENIEQLYCELYRRRFTTLSIKEIMNLRWVAIYNYLIRLNYIDYILVTSENNIADITGCTIYKTTMDGILRWC